MDRHSKASEELCYSMRLVRPFLRLLSRYEGFVVPNWLEEYDPDYRMPIATVHALLKATIEFTGDEDIGLKAASEITRGELGAVDYAVTSAGTVRDAILCSARYQSLLNDALECRLEVDGERAAVRLDTVVAMPRAAADFAVRTFYLHHSYGWPREIVAELDICFSHPRPRDDAEYRRAFPNNTVRFAAPYSGLSLKKRHLELPLETADPQLHDILRKYADTTLAELPKVKNVTGTVRDVIAEHLASGNLTAESVARRMNMSLRTLGRKLEREGTTFKDVLNELRRELALRYIGDHYLGLSDVAFLLGFSQTAAFHRAFKRWTGQTPLHYRRGKEE